MGAVNFMIDCKSDPGRPVGMLLNLYKNPQKGEPETARVYTKKEQRLYERLKYVDYVVNELNIKSFGEEIKHIIRNIDNLKDLCGLCKWETIITAIAFYIKCYHYSNCKNTHVERYKICRENELTFSKFSTITFNLSIKFRTVKSLSPLCPIRE